MSNFVFFRGLNVAHNQGARFFGVPGRVPRGVPGSSEGSSGEFRVPGFRGQYIQLLLGGVPGTVYSTSLLFLFGAWFLRM